MSRKPWPFLTPLGLLLAALGLTACNGSPGDPVANHKGFELSLLVGSAWGSFASRPPPNSISNNRNCRVEKTFT